MAEKHKEVAGTHPPPPKILLIQTFVKSIYNFVLLFLCPVKRKMTFGTCHSVIS